MEKIWDLFLIIVSLYIGYQFIFNYKKLVVKSCKNWEKWLPFHKFSKLEIEIWEYLYIISGLVFIIFTIRSLLKFFNF